jgi:DNA-binding NtrC family response regulator
MNFVFDRQRIVVAGEDSATVALTIATLRRDGHCATHAADGGSASWDMAHGDCHLLIVSGGIGGAARSDLLDDLRERLPGLALLCLTETKWTPMRGDANSRPTVATLREPFTAEELRAAVRPLLPQLQVGTVLAQKVREDSPVRPGTPRRPPPSS